MSGETVILDSPIDFVIVGPTGGKDRLLVRSRNAGLDLVGLAANGDESAPPKTDPLSVLLLGTQKLNLVHSRPIPDLNSDIDTRNSTFKLSWKGFATYSWYRRIVDAFELHTADLFESFKRGDAGSVELAIAPVILLCSNANEQLLRQRRLLGLSLAIYLGIGVITLVALVIQQLIRATVKF